LVTASDLEQAARGFTDLGVTRALELPSTAGARRVRGARVLVVVGPQRAGAADHQPESPDLLEEIRARLAPRLPLGQRLSVIAPNYITARITARLVAVANVDPSIVAKAASDALRTRLAIVPAEPGASEWPFGRDVTALAVKGWLRKVDGVAKVAEVTLTGDEAGGVDKDGNLTLGPIDLPRLAIDVTNIIVDRSPQGARR
jgi:phage-related baseplate assembly protein